MTRSLGRTVIAESMDEGLLTVPAAGKGEAVTAAGTVGPPAAGSDESLMAAGKFVTPAGKGGNEAAVPAGALTFPVA